MDESEGKERPGPEQRRPDPKMVLDMIERTINLFINEQTIQVIEAEQRAMEESSGDDDEYSEDYGLDEMNSESDGNNNNNMKNQIQWANTKPADVPMINLHKFNKPVDVKELDNQKPKAPAAAFIDDWDDNGSDSNGRVDSEEPDDDENFEFEDEDWGELI